MVWPPDRAAPAPAAPSSGAVRSRSTGAAQIGRRSSRGSTASASVVTDPAKRRQRGIVMAADSATPEEAKAMLERAKKVLTEVEQFELSARLVRDPFDSNWRIGVIPTIAPYLLPQLIAAATEALPTRNCQDHFPSSIKIVGGK